MLRRSLLLAAAMLVAWTMPVHAQDKPRYGGELIFAVPSEPPSYDAHREETFGVIHPMAPHYNTLLRVDPFDRLQGRTHLHLQDPARREVPRRQ